MPHWLVKVEPGAYPFVRLVEEGRTRWDGVRNFAARNHLRAMQPGDEVLYYHTGDERAVVGIARVDGEPYADPTAEEGDWTAVDLAPVAALARSVSLAEIKGVKALAKLELLRQSRLSVMPVSSVHFRAIEKLGGGRVG